MELLYCLIIAAAVIIISLILGIISYHKKAKFFTWFRILYGGCFLVVCVLLYPVIGKGYTAFIKILLSVQNALQVFTVNINAGDTLKEIAAGFKGLCSRVYSYILMILMLVSPVFTATFILSFFKRVRVWFSLLFHSRKTRYIFSELNYANYNVAKSIIERSQKDRKDKDRIKKPLIVFTDVYYDSSNESRSELIEKAKELGALCIGDDILSMQKVNKICNNTEVYLMLADYDDYSNIQTLCALSEEETLNAARRKFGNNIKVHVFFGNNSFSSTYKNARDLIFNLQKDCGFREVTRNNWKKDLIYQLLQKAPLFESIQYKTTEKDTVKLRISIIGAGNFGTEMFLNSYWCGQMSEVELHLNVASNVEDEEEFKKRINGISPEIFESSIENSEVLRVSGDVYSEPYFKFGYLKCDALSCKLSEIVFKESGDALLDSEYIFVSLGNDEKSIDFTQKLQRELCRNDLKNAAGNNSPSRRKPVIVCIVNNENIFNALDKTAKSGSDSNVRYLSVTKDAYSYETVFKANLRDLGEKIKASYDELKGKTMNDWESDEYRLNSDIARAVHSPYLDYSAKKHLKLWNPKTDYKKLVANEKDSLEKYKSEMETDEKVEKIIEEVFSDGSEPKDFNNLSEEISKRTEIPNEIKEIIKENEKEISEIISNVQNTKTGDAVSEIYTLILDEKWSDIFKKESERNTLHAELRWLEHRRWNAFIRSEGFVYAYNGGKKDLKYRTQNCLVECNNDSKGFIEDNLPASYKRYDDPLFNLDNSEESKS